MSDFRVTRLDEGVDFSNLPYWDVIVIGAGPADLAAGLTTVHRALECVRVLGSVANRGLVSRAREERRTAMAPIGYGSRQRDLLCNLAGSSRSSQRNRPQPPCSLRVMGGVGPSTLLRTLEVE